MFQQSFSTTGSSLRLLKVGEQGTVSPFSQISDSIAHKLRSNGIRPGTQIMLEQRFPRFIVRVGSGTVTNRVALDDLSVKAVYVRLTQKTRV